MNKLFTRIATLGVGLAMAIGVGVAVESKARDVARVDAATTTTLSWTSKCGGKGTGTGGESWTVTSDATESTFDSGKGIHYGTNNAAVTYIQCETSGITGIVTQIVVNCSGNNSPSLSATVGGTNLSAAKTNITTSNDAYTFTGSLEASSTNSIVVKLYKSSSAKKALYIKSIAVTYSTSSATPLDAPSNLAWDSVNSKVTWSASTNAGGYKISINGESWSETTSNLYYVVSTSPSTIYNVQVKAVPSPSDETHSDSSPASLTFNTLVGDGSFDNPYIVADAIAVIDSNTGLTDKYVTGIVTQIITSWGSNKITFDISSDGETSSQQFRFYGCASSTEHPISSDDDVEERATIIGFGTLAKYNSIYEYASGCKIVSYTAPAPVAKHNLEYSIGDHGEYDGETTKLFEVDEGKKHTVLTAEDVGISAVSGFAFSGWSDGTTTYQPNDEYTMGGSDVTLTAIWEVYVDPSVYFTKITSASDISDGKYAIVYSNLMFDGSLTNLDSTPNTVEITLQNILTSYFTISNGKILSKSGYYIGRTGDSNGLDSSTSTQYENSVTIDENENLVVCASGGAYLRYNKTSGQEKFRYYKSSTYTAQQAIQLYKINFDKVFEDAITCTGNAGTHSFNLGLTWKSNGTNLSLENLYNTLSTYDKSHLSSETYAKYDYIVGKYNKLLHDESYNDFMNRDPSPAAGSRIVGDLAYLDSNSATTIIVVISLVSLAAVGGYFLLKKKKEQ